MRKTISTDATTIAALDRLREQTGANHSESIRRAVLVYAPMILRKPNGRKARR